MTARENVADWLGRGAPPEELNVRLRSDLRAVLASAPVETTERLPWPRDPEPGSADDFGPVGIDYELTVHVRTGDDTDDMSSVTLRTGALYDPRVGLAEQMHEALVPLVDEGVRMVEPSAKRRAY